MAARRFLLLAVPLGAARALAPSFDTFRGNACGRWDGARYTWSRVRREELIEIANLGPESWYLGPPAKCATRVDEVMRSCGGAVQGVKVHLFDGEMGGSADIADDESYIDGDALTLNRQDDGFVCVSSCRVARSSSRGGASAREESRMRIYIVRARAHLAIASRIASRLRASQSRSLRVASNLRASRSRSAAHCCISRRCASRPRCRSSHHRVVDPSRRAQVL